MQDYSCHRGRSAIHNRGFSAGMTYRATSTGQNGLFVSSTKREIRSNLDYNLLNHGNQIAPKTTITDPCTGEVVIIKLVDVARVLNLCNEVTDQESAGVEIKAEFKKFTKHPNAIWKTSLNALRQTL